MSVKDEKEYKIMRDHCTFEQDKGVLVAKYLFCKDPKVLINNGAKALACQKTQESRNIKNRTHEMYV